MLRASSEVFASALRDPSGRADEAVAARRRGGGLWFYVPDEAVARRERTSAYLEQCEGTLRAREEELAQNMLELRALRAQLRESPPKLTRTPPGAPGCVRVPAPPARCTQLRLEAACPRGGYCTYAVHAAASGAPYAPRTVARTATVVTYLLTSYLLHRRSQDALARVEAFIGGAKMEEARRRRGWRSLLKR